MQSVQVFKGIVHPKIKMIPSFTHPQAILGVYDYEHNWGYMKGVVHF